MTLRPVSRLVHRIAALPLIANAVSAFDGKVMFRSDAAATRLLQELRPSLVLAPASAMDSYSHMVIRSALQLGIPIAMVVTHWDYFSKKGLLRVKPDRIYVWGESMRELAVSSNRLDPEMIRVVGVPHFERYIGAVEKRRESARVRLGVPTGAMALLFAGTGAPYDELTILRRLDTVLGRKNGVETRIIYRPHPRAWARRRAEHFDVNTLASVIVDLPAQDAPTPFEHYLDLMAAIDGIVSPFSTMILEGALCGKPSLCVSFGDEVNEWDFSAANGAEHIRAVRGQAWLDTCTESADLERMFEAFLEKLGDRSLSARIMQEIKRTIYYDQESYSERLCRFLRTDFAL